MELGRRRLLGLGAAVAVAAATSSCRGEDPVAGPSAPGSTPTPTPTSTPTSTPVPTPSSTSLTEPWTLPPPGSLYYGASVPHGRSVPDWEARLGSTLSLHRSYFKTDENETSQLVLQVEHDVSRGRLSHVSVKPSWTWAEIASGGRDEWLDDLLTQLQGLSAPVLLTLHHEPENEAGAAAMLPADFVAMQRRAIERAADLAPQVVVVPVLQHWTFDPLRTDIDPSVWLVPEARVMGLDVYNPWAPANGKRWRSFGSKMDEIRGWFGDTPIAIGEYGCREDPSIPGLAAEWLSDAADYARENNVVSMSYFNSGVQSPDGSWALSGSAEQTFAELLASEWVARIA